METVTSLVLDSHAARHVRKSLDRLGAFKQIDSFADFQEARTAYIQYLEAFRYAEAELAPQEAEFFSNLEEEANIELARIGTAAIHIFDVSDMEAQIPEENFKEVQEAISWACLIPAPALKEAAQKILYKLSRSKIHVFLSLIEKEINKLETGESTAYETSNGARIYAMMQAIIQASHDIASESERHSISVDFNEYQSLLDQFKTLLNRYRTTIPDRGRYVDTLTDGLYSFEKLAQKGLDDHRAEVKSSVISVA